MRSAAFGTLAVVAALLVAGGAQSRQGDKPADSAKAKKTRELLKTKLTLDIGETELPNLIEELQEAWQEKAKTKGKVPVKLDTKAGINRNKRLKYACKDKSVEDILAELLGKNGWGYFVNSNAKDSQFDGAIWVRPGKERGYPEAK
jgi:hypothetical protein